jgi:hypothetical protein|nr:MAG TPA: hypothetical protein [Bacteriophage sp.]
MHGLTYRGDKVEEYRAFLSDLDSVTYTYNLVRREEGQGIGVQIKGNVAELELYGVKWKLELSKETMGLFKEAIGNKEKVTLEEINKFMTAYAEGLIVYVLVGFSLRLLNDEEKENGSIVIKEIIRLISKTRGTYEDIVKAVDEYLGRLRKNLSVLNSEFTKVAFSTARDILRDEEESFYWVKVDKKRLCKKMDDLQKKLYK